MASQIAVVQFTTPASPGTLNITSGSITETFSAAIFILGNSTSDSSDNTHGVLGIGWCVNNANATNVNGAIGIQIENGVTTSDNGTRNSEVACISIPAGGAVATPNIVADFNAAVAGGVQLDFTTTTVQAKGVAILFAGLTAADADLISSTSLGGSVACVAPGGSNFEPDLLVWLTNDHPGGSTDEAEAQPSLGFTVNDGGPTQVCAFLNFDESSTTDSDGSLRSDSSFGWLNLTTRVVERGGVDAFTSTGFDHSSDLAGGIRASYLALKFPEALNIGCAHLPVSASTGDQDFALGFAPELVLGMSTLLAAIDTLTDGATASALGYFVTGDLGSRAYTAREREGVVLNPTTTTATSRQEDVGLLTYDHLGAIAHRATWVGGIGSGFRLNFTSATAGYLTVLGIGAADLELVAPSESVAIGDGAVFLAAQNLVTSESVAISDGDPVGLLASAVGAAAPMGVSAQAGAAKGATAQAGASQGRTAS